MPRCIVFGPRDTDVVSIVTRECPTATILKFDEDGGITGIFPDDPKDKLTKAGLHVVVLEPYLNSVIWRPFLIRGAPGTGVETDRKIAETIQKRFNGRPTGEKSRFEIPIPVPSFDDSVSWQEKARHEYNLLMETLKSMECTLTEKSGINIEIGLMRW